MLSPPDRIISGPPNVESLHAQVHGYLRREMHSRIILPTACIKFNELSKKFNIRKMPLWDAIIQIESKGFATVVPRRSVRVNRLSVPDIKHIFKVSPALESAVRVKSPVIRCAAHCTRNLLSKGGDYTKIK
jgi:DNA-binding GntR family transcriptional regulator